MLKRENSLRDLQDDKQKNIHIQESQKQERKGCKILFEKMTENFPNLGEETNFQFQEAQRIPNEMNPVVSIRPIISEMSKFEDTGRLLNAAGEKQLVCTRETPRGCHQIFKQKLCRPEGSGMIFKVLKATNFNQAYFPQQGYHSELKER